MDLHEDHPPHAGSERDAAERVWEQLAGRVSSAAMRARALRSHHQRDDRLAIELDALIVELDGAFGTVMRNSSVIPTPPGRDGVREPSSSSVAGRFCAWVRDGCPDGPGDETATRRADRRPEANEDIATLLSELSGVQSPVPDDVAAGLAMPSGGSYAAAVARLRWARRALDGPRRSSYRSAYQHLSVDPVPPGPRGP